MSNITCPKSRYKHPSAVRNCAVDCTDELDEGEIVTSATVAVSPSGPTLSAASVNTAPRRVGNRTCKAGTVVTFSISGGTADATYSVTVTLTTSGSQTIPVIVTIPVSST